MRRLLLWLLLGVAIPLGVGCSNTDAVTPTEAGGCKYRSVDRLFGVPLITQEWFDDCPEEG